jgi:hypothetical protein
MPYKKLDTNKNVKKHTGIFSIDILPINPTPIRTIMAQLSFILPDSC